MSIDWHSRQNSIAYGKRAKGQPENHSEQAESTGIASKPKSDRLNLSDSKRSNLQPTASVSPKDAYIDRQTALHLSLCDSMD